MRNAFTVLVSLCIGVVAGNIVPSGKPELPKFGVLADTFVEKLNARVNSINSILDSPPKTDKTATLQNHLDKINDKALYEHGQIKQNIVNERSFLFLNQKYKKPIRSQHHLSGSSCDVFDQSPKEESADQLSGTPFKFSMSRFEEMHKPLPNLAKVDNKPSYFAPPSNCNLDEKGDTYVETNGLSNVQRKYLDLLKEPILRPMKTQNQYKEKQIMSSRAHQTHMDDGTKQYYILPKVVQENQISGIVKTYGFTRPYQLHRPVFNKELEAAGANFINDDDVPNVLSGASEDTLLDRFLKATMTEQEHRERLQANQVNCKHNCVLKSTKSVPNENTGFEANCKCGRWVPLKLPNVNDRPQREQNKHYETTVGSISAELSNYEEILAEQWHSKSDNEMKKSMRKFKNTLHE